MKPVSLISTLLLYVILSSAAAASGLAGPYPTVNSNDTVHDEVYPNLTEDSIPTMSGATRSSFSIPNLTAGMWPEAPHAAQLRAASMPTPALATGAAVFDVPLYTLSVDGVEIPFSLRYHSNGIKVEEDPFPVGYGWTLLPGLKITRKVMGRPDGYLERVPTDEDQMISHAIMHRSIAIYGNTTNVPLDPEYDIFTIHLPDKSFNAYYNDGRLIAPGYSDFIIDVGDGFKSFKITDPEGRIWNFDKLGAVNEELDRCEWGLSSVTMPSGKKIEFSWKGGRHCTWIRKYPLSYDYYYNISSHLYGSPSLGCDSKRTIALSFPEEALNISGVYFPGGNITFNYEGGVLMGVCVNNDSSEVDKISFSHETVTEDMPLLLSITLGNGGKYSFEYDGTRFSRLSQQDYWGYYNGSSSAWLGCPSMDLHNLGCLNTPKEIAGFDRRVNEEKMKAMILLKAIIPTGGFIEWEYEPHRFKPVLFIDSDNIKRTIDKSLSCGGGLRVKSMTMNEGGDGSDSRTVRYVYGENGDGLANIESCPTGSTFLSQRSIVVQRMILEDYNPYSPLVLEYGMLTASPYSNYDAYRFGEDLIWYSRVVEEHGEGKCIHKFMKCGGNYVIHEGLGRNVPVEIGALFSGGLVESEKETYRKSNNGDVMVEKECYDYDEEEGDPLLGLYIERHKVQSSLPCAPDFDEGLYVLFPIDIIPGCDEFLECPEPGYYYTYSDGDIYNPFIYKIKTSVTRLKSKTHTEYTTNLPRTVTEEYTYVPGTMRQSSVTLKNNVQSVRTDITYSGSYGGTVGAAMKAANAVGIITGKKITVGSSSSEWKMTYSSRNNGKLFRPTEVKCRRGSAALHSTGTYVWNSDGTLKSAKNPAGIEMAYTWDTYGRYPLTMTLGGTLTSKAEWKPLVGVSSLTDPAGVKTSYGYDSANRLASVSLNGKLLESYEYAISQTGQNSVTTKKYTSNSSYISTVERYDGLGRVWGTFVEDPDFKAVYGWRGNLTEYDGMGRVWRVWASVPLSSADVMKEQMKTSTMSVYNDWYPYKETSYESSPRALPVSMTVEGEAWHENGKKKKTGRCTNDSVSYRCNLYTPTSTGVTKNGLWPNSSLSVTVETDEDGLTLETYTDLSGKTVCEKRNGVSVYYVYDDYGDLRYILPSGVHDGGERSTAAMSGLAYWYDYDMMGRCVLKKLPGAKACRYRYDPADRLVAEQTHNHEDGKWRLYAYDNCGRQVLVIDASLTDSEVSVFASKCRTATPSASGNIKGYSLSPAPVDKILSSTVEAASYYDTYDFIDNLGMPANLKFKNPFTELGISSRIGPGKAGKTLPGSSMGKLTGLWTGKGWETYHYNSEGREIQRYATGFTKGRRNMFYNYDGNVSSVHYCYDEGETLQKSASSLHDRDIYFTYDKAGRETKRKITERYIPKGMSIERVDSAVITTQYDVLGRIRSVIKGPVKYWFYYDVRGWTRGRQFVSPKWEKYESLAFENGPKPRYNGFISQRTWDGNTYSFEYDKRGFLHKASYAGDDAKADYTEVFTHDNLGNVTSVDRIGVSDILPSGNMLYDNSEFVYGTFSGNRMTSAIVESYAEVFDRRTGLRKTGYDSYEFGYDDSGRLISDGTRDITSISYDNNGFPYAVITDDGDKKTQMIMVRDFSGNIIARHIYEIKTEITNIESMYYNGDGQVVRNDTLLMSRFDGGYFDYDGKPHYYLTDWQGNNIGVYDGNGELEQRVDYYPSGEPWLEPEYNEKEGLNRYLFGNKERIVAGRLNEYDFLARTYVASQCRFTTLDPLAEKTPWLSPYAYCAGNPVNFIDPDGRSVHVRRDKNGNYEIIEGTLEDEDMNIYEYLQDDKGNYTIRGNSIGVTTSLTSFYNSDSGEWAIGSVIRTDDKSGIEFLDKIINKTPSLDDYIYNARNGCPYDFKSNDMPEKYTDEEKIKYYYRGMPVGSFRNGKMVISSARDIGNYGAGYVAGSHGLPCIDARLGFDLYQSITNGEITAEGISTQNAENLGWIDGRNSTTLIHKLVNIERTKYSSPGTLIKFMLEFMVNGIKNK